MTQTVLITGAGTGFGKNIAFALAEKGNPVIATVEVMSQVSALEQEARERGVKMQIEKLDVTNPKDREKAWAWDIDVLVNNAAVKEGGSLVDIPEANLRHQFEANVFGPILLTKDLPVKWWIENTDALFSYLPYPVLQRTRCPDRILVQNIL